MPTEFPAFEPWKAKALYHRFVDILCVEYDEAPWRPLLFRLDDFIEELESLHAAVKVPKTVVHNDFNPRNVAIRQNGQVCICDWELALYNFPHRDIVEFLSFALPLEFDKAVFMDYVVYHYELSAPAVTREAWKAAYAYALKEYLVTRVTFYMTGKIVMNYTFAERIFLNAFRMLALLSEDKN